MIQIYKEIWMSYSLQKPVTNVNVTNKTGTGLETPREMQAKADFEMEHKDQFKRPE